MFHDNNRLTNNFAYHLTNNDQTSNLEVKIVVRAVIRAGARSATASRATFRVKGTTEGSERVIAGWRNSGSTHDSSDQRASATMVSKNDIRVVEKKHETFQNSISKKCTPRHLAGCPAGAQTLFQSLICVLALQHKVL